MGSYEKSPQTSISENPTPSRPERVYPLSSHSMDLSMDISKKRKADDNGAFFPTTTDSITTQPPTHLTPEDADRILEPFTKDQLHSILRTALLHHPDILTAVRSVADSDPAQRKLFIRGLGWETTTEKLRSIFSAFGELEEAIVITDKNTGKSKGYGFVTFKHIDGSILALKEPNKKVDGRITVAQLAAAGNSGVSNGIDVSLRKIYVGNVPFEISSERLLLHFSAYGEIEEGPLGFDKQTGKPKGFAFFVYKTEEGARASLVDPIKNVDGHQVICKLATDNKKGRTQQPGGLPGEGMPAPGSMPGTMNSNYGVPGGGMSNYGGFSGGPAAGLPHQNTNLTPGISGLGGPGYGNQGQPGSYAGGGGGYGGAGGYGTGGSQFGGGAAGTGEYGGLNNSGSSMYRMPSSSGLPSSGGYPGGGNYGSVYSTQLQQPSPGGPPRVPPGGMYQGMPPYY
ncbi:unnamed protein product [Ilex paraguariensis]|uniref:RRM domain-containing protein n=1 Tax=Ilex paraguariensis TaxID=185542 RepID=A0ABC8RUA9_9AQUA